MKPLKLLIWLLVPLLLWWALREVSFNQVGFALSRLTLSQITLLIGLNLLIFFLFSSRWWLISYQQGYRLPYHKLVLYRLAAFGFSYYTPGPQLGGLPLQVHLLSKRHSLPPSAALTSVTLDKLVELSVNFTVLPAGIAFILMQGTLSNFGSLPPILLASLLFFLPLACLGLLYLGIMPLSTLKRPLRFLRGRSANLDKLGSLTLNAETQVSDLIRRSPRLIISLLLLSLLVWSLSILEYHLMLKYLGLSLPLPHVIALLSAARLAFLTPMPGGIGALEAAQVFAISTLGYDPTLGISASLIIRARDLTLGAVGLWLAAILSSNSSSESLPLQAGD
jgi:glycosyltransferase 2 family protein